jgi:hypothetical protein
MISIFFNVHFKPNIKNNLNNLKKEKIGKRIDKLI